MTKRITYKTRYKRIKILTIFLLAFFFLSVFTGTQAAAAENEAIIRVAEIYNAEVDTFVEVPVYLENAPGVAGFQFDLRFNPEIAVVKSRVESTPAVKLGSILSGSDPIVNYNNADQGLIRVAWMDLNEVIEDGEICRITFKVLSKGTTGLELDRVELTRLSGKYGINSVNGFITTDKQADVRVRGVSIKEEDQDLITGDTVQLNAVVEPINANNRQVTWVSSESAVASVSSNGMVTAHKEGSAVITVTTRDGGFKDTVKITVRPKGIIVDAPSQLPHAYTGEEYEYVLTARGENDTFTWSISSGELPPDLELDTSGKITGTPTATGRFDFTLKIKDKDGNEKKKDFILWVAEKASTDYVGGVLYTDRGNFKGLTISHSSLEVNLQPQEMPFTMVIIDRNVNHINIEVDLYDPKDKLTINDSSQAPSSLKTYNLRPGNNTFVITLQPSSGGIRQYSITVFKIP